MLPPLTLGGSLRYDIIRRRLRELPVRTVLEVGPGMGALATRLALRYDYVGVELDAESARIAADRLARVGRGRIVHGMTADVAGAFDLVCSFEVLEHIEDDAGAVREWRELIKPDGWLMLSVPAWQSRWGALDDRAGHFRRYEREQMLRLLSDSGFDRTEVLSYGFPLLNVVQPLWNALSARDADTRTIDARTRSSARFHQPSKWSGYAREAVASPFAWLQRPFLHSRRGVGFVVFAHRRD
jgi:SAM-dependent methyltransferase